MSSKQKLAIIAPLLVIAVMYPIFRILARAFGDNWRIGWFLGLATYWLIWGAAFPFLMIGKGSIRRIIRPQKPNVRVVLLVIFPLLMASLYRLIPGMGYQKTSLWILLLVFSTPFGNGFFEELLWRGVYMELFPNSMWLRIVWPSIWFALWHYVPGSVSPTGNALGLMIGSGLFGFYLSFLAKKTNTVWWSIVAHVLGGIIMIA